MDTKNETATNPVAAAEETPLVPEVPTLPNQSLHLTPESRFAYLEQIRDFTYKDVVLADTKAGLSLTIVAASIAAYAALFEKLSQVKAPWLLLVHSFGIAGLVCGALAVLCAMFTVLPRSYISHEMALDSNHWVQMRSGWRAGLRRRVFDASLVLVENIWQRQTKGTPQSLEMLLKNSLRQEEINEVMYASMRRAVLVQNLKYLWVGKSILLAFATFILVAFSFFFGIVPTLPTLEAAPPVAQKPVPPNPLRPNIAVEGTLRDKAAPRPSP